VEVIEKIPIETGEHFLAINENSDTLYVSNNASNSIQVIDCSSNKVTNRIEIEKPRQLVANSAENTLFVISGEPGFRLRDNGAKISIIDTISNKIISSVGEKEGFGDIDLNEETNVVYATQPKSKRVWAIDCHTKNVLDKINVKNDYYVLVVDTKGNRVFLGGNEGILKKVSFGQIDTTNNKFSKIANRHTFTSNRPKELFFSNTHNKLFFCIDGSPAGDYSDYNTYVQQIDLNSNSFGDKVKRGGQENRMGFDSTRNVIYFPDVKNGEFKVLDHTLKEIGLFQYAEKPSGLKEKFKRKLGMVKICVNPKTSEIYFSEQGNDLLYVIKD